MFTYFLINTKIKYILILFYKIILANLQIPSKKWNLEDDSDEEEEGKNNADKMIEEEELDPLDAFMQVKLNVLLILKIDIG